MNLNEIKNAITHLQKSCSCSQCKSKYDTTNIQIIATTGIEGLLEMRCPKCHTSTLVTVLMTTIDSTNLPQIETVTSENADRIHKGIISKDDILDVKNFLITFDGNFKKIFNKESQL